MGGSVLGFLAASKVVSTKVLSPQEIEFAFKEHGQLIVRCGEYHLPITSDHYFSQVVEKRETVQVIDMSNRVVDQNQRRGGTKLRVLCQKERQGKCCPLTGADLLEVCRSAAVLAHQRGQRIAKSGKLGRGVDAGEDGLDGNAILTKRFFHSTVERVLVDDLTQHLLGLGKSLNPGQQPIKLLLELLFACRRLG